MKPFLRATLALALLAGGTAGAQAERLIVSVSNHRVTVTPNYAGEELVLFGAIERDATTPANRTNYDIVITVSGPRATMITFRKERTFGIWINRESREFINVPAYLSVMSNRPIETVAPAEVQRRQQLGLNNIILTQRVGADFADVVADPACDRDAFRAHWSPASLASDAARTGWVEPDLAPLPWPAVGPAGTRSAG